MIEDALRANRIPNQREQLEKLAKNSGQRKRQEAAYDRFMLDMAVKQLYTDVDSDHQQQMLTSSIYIDGGDTERQSRNSHYSDVLPPGNSLPAI